MTKSKSSKFITRLIEAGLYLLIVYFSYYLLLRYNYPVDIAPEYLNAYEKSYWILLIWSLLVLIFNKGFSTLKLRKSENLFVMFISTLLIFAFYSVMILINPDYKIPLNVIALAGIIQFIMFFIVKLMLKLIFYKTRKIKKILIYSNEMKKEEIVTKLFSRNLKNEKLKYFVGFSEEYKDESLEILKKVDKVYICSSFRRDVVEKIVQECTLLNVDVCLIPKNYEILVANSTLDIAEDLPLIKINNLGISFEYRIVKRIMDIVLSLIGIIIFMPFMIITAILIFIQDGTPVIYRQKRVTKDGKEFTLYKFRSMIKNAEKETGAVWASTNDTRITKLGKIMRKFWLDEFPQFFNILKGDMSFVGPRPERPELIEEFCKEHPDFKYRTAVKAGMTGYAQNVALYSTPPENKLKFDLFYIENASLLFDLRIIFDTVKKVFLQLFGVKRIDITYAEFLDRNNLIENDNGHFIEYSIKD